MNEDKTVIPSLVPEPLQKRKWLMILLIILAIPFVILLVWRLTFFLLSLAFPDRTRPDDSRLQLQTLYIPKESTSHPVVPSHYRAPAQITDTASDLNGLTEIVYHTDNHDYVTPHPDYRYYRDAEHVYFTGGSDGIIIIENADPKTFTIDVKGKTQMKNYYLEFTQDKNTVYFRGVPTPFSQNFFVLDNGSRKDCGPPPYVVNIVDNTPTIFIVVVHYDSPAEFVEIKNADLDTFEVLWTGYSKDKNHVYGGDGGITSYDPESFDRDDAMAKCPIG